ncbi:hypothetical protein ACFVZ3_35600 [Kitasatospora purpeofusca]|uniref:hypothetical protein n=1 Tax=Kitasatospora purpeofusca TaxID=67352 RepID=UPI0036797CE7
MSIKSKAVRTLSSLALVAGSTLGVGMATAGEAHAAGYGCPGSLVWQQDITGNGSYSNTVVATVYGYWNGVNNCEVAVKRVFVGQKTRMDFWLYSDTPGSPAHDPGEFSSYAGPLTAYNNAHGCVWEEVDMWDAQGHEIAQSYWGSKHNCG